MRATFLHMGSQQFRQRQKHASCVCGQNLNESYIFVKNMAVDPSPLGGPREMAPRSVEKQRMDLFRPFDNKIFLIQRTDKVH